MVRLLCVTDSAILTQFVVPAGPVIRRSVAADYKASVYLPTSLQTRTPFSSKICNSNATRALVPIWCMQLDNCVVHQRAHSHERGSIGHAANSIRHAHLGGRRDGVASVDRLQVLERSRLGRGHRHFCFDVCSTRVPANLSGRTRTRSLFLTQMKIYCEVLQRVYVRKLFRCSEPNHVKYFVTAQLQEHDIDLQPTQFARAISRAARKKNHESCTRAGQRKKDQCPPPPSEKIACWNFAHISSLDRFAGSFLEFEETIVMQIDFSLFSVFLKFLLSATWSCLHLEQQS